MNKTNVLRLVNKALDINFDLYSWERMIDDIEGLTKREKAYAKNYLYYKAYIAE